MTAVHELASGSTAAREADLDALDWRLLDEFQHGFPIIPQPYAELARRLDITETEVLGRLSRLQLRGCISRIGPVFRPHSIGSSCLAAMAVPADCLDRVAGYVNAQPEVNHNYQREHRFNLWFVATGRDQAGIEAVIGRIETATGYKVMALPMLASYHIDLGFSLR
ncbi:MAG: AsnC family transcriptional regulator [Gammaproteobacteria bacterium]|nr:AsnC family transcriptional regulator [Gammaproteobacteria bacterium]